MKVILDEKTADIGGFTVGRLLPSHKKRMVGPFTFIDHMGPTTIGPGRYTSLGQHPHIGLSTLTYLLEGEMLHKDSIGSVQKITPGAVNWMTAGRGIVHNELTPEELQDGREHGMHGYQIWVALPVEYEDIAPEFHHVPASGLPRWSDGGLEYTLIAGEAYGEKSPVPVYSDLYMLDVRSEGESTVDFGAKLYDEIGICVVAGRVDIGPDTIEPRQMFITDAGDLPEVTLLPETQILIFGGRPLDEKRYMDWNFVSSDREKLKAAKENWKAKMFELIPGDDSYIPYPE